MYLSEMERRNGYRDDLDAMRLTDGPFTVTVVASVIYALALIVIACIWVVNEPETSPWPKFGRMSVRYWIVVLAIVASTLLWGYAGQKKRRLFYADIPTNLPGWGWYRLTMRIFFPIYLVSLLRMHYWDKHYATKIYEWQGLGQSDQAPNPGVYTLFYRHSMPQVRVAQLQENADLIAQAEEQLRDIRQELRTQMSYIERLKSERAMLESADNEIGPEDALKAWKIIRQLKGVKYVFSRQVDGRWWLYIDIAVRYRLRNYIYDLGDYRIAISGLELTCEQMRSGVKEDCSTREAEYVGDDGSFKFDREIIGKLEQLMGRGAYCKVISTIVDELHKIDAEDIELIPSCFQRVGSIPKR